MPANDRADFTSRRCRHLVSHRAGAYEWGWRMHPMWGWGWGVGMMAMMLLFWGVVIFAGVAGIRWFIGQSKPAARRLGHGNLARKICPRRDRQR